MGSDIVFRLIPVLTGNRYSKSVNLYLLSVNPRAYGEQIDKLITEPEYHG